MAMPNARNKWLGVESVNNQGCKMKIIQYNKSDDILVQFLDEPYYTTHAQMSAFKKGNIKNPFFPSVCGVGYYGEIKKINFSNPFEKYIYHVWAKMLQRCYCDEYMKRTHRTSYLDCLVCDEWHNFTNFREWYLTNCYEINCDEILCLDKDILFPKNNIYAPNRCILIPNRINTFFVRMGYPRIIQPSKNRFQLFVSKHNHCTYEGSFKTIDEAENKYWKIKKQRLLDLCEEYKNYLPNDIYELLINLDLTKYKKGVNNE